MLLVGVTLDVDEGPAKGIVPPGVEPDGEAAWTAVELSDRFDRDRAGLEGGRTRLNAGPRDAGGRPAGGPAANGPGPPAGGYGRPPGV